MRSFIAINIQSYKARFNPFFFECVFIILGFRFFFITATILRFRSFIIQVSANSILRTRIVNQRANKSRVTISAMAIKAPSGKVINKNLMRKSH